MILNLEGGAWLFFCFVLLASFFWCVLLACSSGVPSMAVFDAIPWHYEILFERPEKYPKGPFRRYSALRVACGNFQNHLINSTR